MQNPIFPSKDGFQNLMCSLDEPRKIQDFIDFHLEYNYGSMTRSPVGVFETRNAHCLDGALFASACLLLHGRRPMLMDLCAERDEDHVLALYRRGKYWGAIAQSKFTGLRFREAIYNSPRELAMSYFEEYYNYSGQKTLRKFSEPFDICASFGTDWVDAEGNLSYIGDALHKVRHYTFLPAGVKMRDLRLVDSLQFQAQAKGNLPRPFGKSKRIPIWTQIRGKHL